MGRIVFNDEAQRKQLEAIVHPLVFERYAELEAATGPDDLVVHDIPLLAETGRAGELRRRGRGRRARGAAGRADAARPRLERGDAGSRIASQATREQRLAIATHVVDNTGTPRASCARASSRSTPS